MTTYNRKRQNPDLAKGQRKIHVSQYVQNLS